MNVCPLSWNSTSIPNGGWEDGWHLANTKLRINDAGWACASWFPSANMRARLPNPLMYCMLHVTVSTSPSARASASARATSSPSPGVPFSSPNVARCLYGKICRKRNRYVYHAPWKAFAAGDGAAFKSPKSTKSMLQLEWRISGNHAAAIHSCPSFPINGGLKIVCGICETVLFASRLQWRLQ